MALSKSEVALIRCSVNQACDAMRKTFDIRTSALIELGGGNLLSDSDRELLDQRGDLATSTVMTKDMVTLLGNEVAIDEGSDE